MQSWFSRYMDEGGLPHIVNGVFELKHVACSGGPRCTTAACDRGLRVGRHEARQAAEMLRAEGRGLRVGGRPAGCTFKLPDDSRGSKPFDCFVLRGASGWFVVGFSCEALEGGFRAWRIPVLVFAKWLAEGKRRVRMVDCMKAGEEVEC